jgi:hypothetical protein
MELSVELLNQNLMSMMTSTATVTVSITGPGIIINHANLTASRRTVRLSGAHKIREMNRGPGAEA